MDKRMISEVSEDFSLQIINLYKKLQSDEVGRVMGRQLLRCGTSIGANVFESKGAESTADFIHKLHIAYKESIETAYWLRLLLKSKRLSENELSSVVEESQRIIRMLTAIIKTSKKKKRK